jgi:hypothetical protein
MKRIVLLAISIIISSSLLNHRRIHTSNGNFNRIKANIKVFTLTEKDHTPSKNESPNMVLADKGLVYIRFGDPVFIYVQLRSQNSVLEQTASKLIVPEEGAFFYLFKFRRGDCSLYSCILYSDSYPIIFQFSYEFKSKVRKEATNLPLQLGTPNSITKKEFKANYCTYISNNFEIWNQELNRLFQSTELHASEKLTKVEMVLHLIDKNAGKESYHLEELNSKLSKVYEKKDYRDDRLFKKFAGVLNQRFVLYRRNRQLPADDTLDTYKRITDYIEEVRIEIDPAKGFLDNPIYKAYLDSYAEDLANAIISFNIYGVYYYNKEGLTSYLRLIYDPFYDLSESNLQAIFAGHDGIKSSSVLEEDIKHFPLGLINYYQQVENATGELLGKIHKLFDTSKKGSQCDGLQVI